MIVTLNNLENVLRDLETRSHLSIDTETTGLRAYAGHRLFSIIIASATSYYYFNFQNYPECAELPRGVLDTLQRRLFDKPDVVWFLHNAKFDLHMLGQDGCELRGTIHCTMAHERLIFNKLPSYALGVVAPRYGQEKSKDVDAYISKHKLYTKRQQLGKKKEIKDLHFDRVPFPVISDYGLKDGRITFEVGQGQRSQLSKFYGSFPPAAQDRARALIANERQLTKVCFELERNGIKIDKRYCEDAFAFTTGRASAAAATFERLTRAELVDSAAALKPIFEAAGVPAGRTAPSTRFPDGQPSYNKAALIASGHPVAAALLEYRKFSKVAGTYFRNFLDLADADGFLHADLRQAGTDTGRFSMGDPNLQNLKKNEDEADADDGEDELDQETTFQVRRAVIPRDPDHCLVMIDYDQQEYRMMLDLAGELDLIRKVLGGLDVHEATAQTMQVPRQRAKMLNFLILYGGGDAKLASATGMALDQAKAQRANYFSALPAVKTFIRSTIQEAERFGRIMNWAERVYFFDRDSAYKAPNTRIQGGGGDVMRFAMTRIADYLRGRRSKMALTVHDELLFDVHKSELAIVPDLKGIMESVYPYKHLPLTCSVSHSWKSWADKIKGAPT